MVVSTAASVWDDRPAPAPRPLSGTVTADLCVVGLGHSGLSAVVEARRLGLDVVGIDARRIGGGAAGRNGGFLLAGLPRFHHDAVGEYGDTVALAWYRATLAELDRVCRDTPGVIRQGSLRVGTSREEVADCESQFDRMRSDGLRVERYRGPEGDGLLFPDDGACNPLARCRHLASRARADGATLFEGTPALQLSAETVDTPYGSVRARHVLVAVDGKLEVLIPELAPGVRTARLQMLATEPLSHLRFPRPVYARYGYEYIHQLQDRRVALGGFRDMAGSTEWTADDTVTVPLQRFLEEYLRTSLGILAPIAHRWAASAGFSRSGLPIVGQLASGVWVTGGYSGTGNLIGSMCGRELVRRLLRHPTLLDDLEVQLPSEVLPPSGRQHKGGQTGVSDRVGDHEIAE